MLELCIDPTLPWVPALLGFPSAPCRLSTTSEAYMLGLVIRVSADPEGRTGYRLSRLPGTHPLLECPFRSRPILTVIRQRERIESKGGFHPQRSFQPHQPY